MNEQSSITFVNEIGAKGQAIHDVLLCHEDSVEAADGLKLLLTDCDKWLKKFTDTAGISTLHHVSLVFIDTPDMDHRKFFVSGMPATKTLAVYFNLKHYADNDTGGAVKSLDDWLNNKDVDIVVTFREDNKQGFVHLDVDQASNPGALFYDVLVNPNTVARVLSDKHFKGKLQVQYVNSGSAWPEPKTDVKPGEIKFSLTHVPLAAGLPAIIYRLSAQPVTSCIVAPGTVASDVVRDADGHFVSPRLELNGFMQMPWSVAPPPPPGC